MPKNKDLKRLARERMAKTGESYTTARAHLVAKAERRRTAEHEKRAGLSDAAAVRATGHGWSWWVDALDAAGMADRPHRDIARHVGESYPVSGWWAQMLTVGYERIRGLRDSRQRRDGAYEAHKSRTFPVPVERLYRAFSHARIRGRWLPGVDWKVRKATPHRSIRLDWEDGSPVELYFTAKGEAKSSVQVQQRELASATEVDAAKQAWSERLDALGRHLSRGSR